MLAMPTMLVPAMARQLPKTDKDSSVATKKRVGFKSSTNTAPVVTRKSDK